VTVVPARGCRVEVAEHLAAEQGSQPSQVEQLAGRTAEVV
jgi:hypothetical protein